MCWQNTNLCDSVIAHIDVSVWRGALENTAQPWQQDRAEPTPWRRTVPPRVFGLDGGWSCIMNLNRMINTHYVRNTRYRPTVDHTTIHRENIHPSSITTYRLGSGAPKEGHPDTIASEYCTHNLLLSGILHYIRYNLELISQSVMYIFQNSSRR